MLTTQGEILNNTDILKVDRIFLPLFETVITNLEEIFADNLHSIYSYGSIAEGRAKVGLSDADFIVILKNPIDDREEKILRESEKIMSKFSNIITKVDFSTVTLEEVLAEKNFYSWGAYLKILGMPIYGDDVRKKFPNFTPGIDITRGFNGDLASCIEKTLLILQSSASEGEKKKEIRGIAGKILRSFFMLIAPEIKFWTTILSEQTEKVTEYFPQYKGVFYCFLEARKHEKEAEEFMEKLKEFQKEVLPIFEKGILLE